MNERNGKSKKGKVPKHLAVNGERLMRLVLTWDV